jgi:hypothetical protein
MLSLRKIIFSAHQRAKAIKTTPFLYFIILFNSTYFRMLVVYVGK